MARDEAGETERGDVSVWEGVNWRGDLDGDIWWGFLTGMLDGEVWRGGLAGGLAVDKAG